YQGFPTENDPTIDDKSFVSYGKWFVKYQEDHGIDMRYQTSLVKLIKKDDTVTGAIVKDLVKDEFYEIDASKGVIIATGGYSANKKLL
ncbi:FAD-binding protein, partial [Lacticaseibacillus rhamnosus]